MPTRSFAIVVLRLISLCSCFYSVYTVAEVIFARSLLSSMSSQMGNLTIGGTASAIDGRFDSMLWMQLRIAAMIFILGIILYRNSGWIGRMITQDLD